MRIVVKVGTSTLAYPTGRLNIRHTEELVKVLSDLKNEGHEVILVSSGAIGMGVGKLSLPTRPKDTTTKQACAAVGQCELMYTYDRLFSAYDHTVAQILLTGVDVEHTERRVNIQNTLTRLLELGALPIINENDTVATDEITSIGDNDTLAAIVTCCIKADLLVLLSDIDGLYTANPHTHPDAKLIPLVEDITPEVMALAAAAADQKKAAEELAKGKPQNAAAAQRSAENNLKQGGATEGTKALQEAAEKAAEAAAKSAAQRPDQPQTSNVKPPLRGLSPHKES